MPGKEATARIKIDKLPEAPTHRARFHPPLWPSVVTAIFRSQIIVDLNFFEFNDLARSISYSDKRLG